jgi:SulP family sulfate permease
VIAGFLISALGGSRVQIGGPTGAFVVIVYGIVQRHGVDGLLVATLMAGVILIALGLARLGTAIKFIPFPVVTGFTAAIGAIIAVQQLRDAFGLRLDHAPAEFIERIEVYLRHADTVNPYAVVLTAITLLIVLLWPRLSHRIPSPFVALIAGSAVAQVLHWPVETIGSRFGEISAALPRPSLPPMSLALIRELAGPAFAIAALGAIESLLSAVVADGMIGGRHRSNMELVAQGVANVASPSSAGCRPPAPSPAPRPTSRVAAGPPWRAWCTHSSSCSLPSSSAAGPRSSRSAVLAAIVLVVAWATQRVEGLRQRAGGPVERRRGDAHHFILTIVVDP